MSYRAIRQLGQGGFGRVEEVIDKQGNHFAKKTLHFDLLTRNPDLSEDQLRHRFDREIRYQSKIDHPNVAKIFQFDTAVSPPYCIMELAQHTLKNEILADRTLGGNPGPALFDILSGLEAIHSLGFKHRDLKPENVLVFIDSSGKKRYAISDFGLVAGVDNQTTTLTATGVGGGTPYYAAPECSNNLHGAIEKSDIYSFGAILHDIFGGGQARIPYSRLSVPDPIIGPIIEKCTESNPHRRYKNVAELREAIYKALHIGPISFVSGEEQRAVSVLNENNTLTQDQWDQICACIDENNRRSISNRNILGALTLAHLDGLRQHSESIFHAIGNIFCDFIVAGEGSFNFEYCDILGDKAAVFFSHGDISLKSRVLIALMILGASHNRWYVEGQFWSRVTSSELDPHVVSRFLIDIEVQNIRLSQYIRHIERSIGVESKNLPATIQHQLAAEELN